MRPYGAVEVEFVADQSGLALLQSQSAGWAVGLVLMLEHVRASGVLQTRLPGETQEGTFKYFAEQVFDQLPAIPRELLLRTAFLPRVTAAAAGALTGNADAEAMLEGLFPKQTANRLRPALGVIESAAHGLAGGQHGKAC